MTPQIAVGRQYRLWQVHDVFGKYGESARCLQYRLAVVYQWPGFVEVFEVQTQGAGDCARTPVQGRGGAQVFAIKGGFYVAVAVTPIAPTLPYPFEWSACRF